jgi:PilZ domain/GYF domain 2
MNGTTQNEFFVNKGETQLGPWTVQEMAARLAAGEIVVTDFVFDEAQNDWVALFQCEAFQAYLRSQKPKAAPPKRTAAPAAEAQAPVEQKQVEEDKTVVLAPVQETQVAQTPVASPVAEMVSVKRPSQAAAAQTGMQADAEATWYVQKGQHRYGPFTHLGVVRALQEKTVYEFDLCWKNGMHEWVRIAQCADFAPERIRELSEQSKSAPGVFTQRQYPRIPFESEVLVHDNRSVWIGRAFEGSAGGSGVVIENATLVPGQTVLLHFAEREDLPAFNALCEIVSKKFVADVKDAKSPVQYSVRFVKLDAQAESRVQKYFLGAEAA